MIISKSLKKKHDTLLVTIKDQMLNDISTNIPNLKVARQRIPVFYALGDLKAYLKKYDPTSLNSKAYTQGNKIADILYDYFEDTAIPYIKDLEKKYPKEFKIYGIDLLKQGYLNNQEFSVYGILQLSHSTGEPRSYSFHRIKDTDEYTISINSNLDHYKKFPFNEQKPFIRIREKDAISTINKIVHVFQRDENPRFSYIGEYIITSEKIKISTSKTWVYVALKKVSVAISEKEEYKYIDQNIAPKEVTSMKSYRDDAEKQKALIRAHGHCENPDCLNPSSFKKDDNSTYLEGHHIIPVIEGGSNNHKINIIALCANCHRQAHYGKDRELLRQLFLKTIKGK